MSNTIEGRLPPSAADIANKTVDSTSRPATNRGAETGTINDAEQASGDSELYSTLLAELKAMSPPMRSSRVEELKAQIAAGAYNPDPNRVAGAIAKGLARD